MITPLLLMLQGSLDVVVYRDIEAMEGFVIEFRVASYKGIDLRHHIDAGLCPFSLGRSDSVHPVGKLQELGIKVYAFQICGQLVEIFRNNIQRPAAESNE